MERNNWKIPRAVVAWSPGVPFPESPLGLTVEEITWAFEQL